MVELVDEDLVNSRDLSALQSDEVAHNKDTLALGYTVEKRDLLASFDCGGTKLHDIRHIVVSGVRVPKHGGKP
jgi:hypothetical protein